jgi:tRNA threonylcarbamoyladenosine biosynthesis protein TsaB
MRVLAVDTSGDRCAAGLWQDGALLAADGMPMRHGHAEALLPMIMAVLDRAGLTAGDADVLATTTGPGAFTGLRIGLAALGGIALATGRPIVGVSTFEALAAAVPADRLAGRPLLVAIDSRRAEPYVQAFRAGRTLTGGFSASAEALRGFLAAPPAGLDPRGEGWAVAGSGARRAVALVPRAGLDIVDEAPVDPAVLAELAAAHPERASADPPPPLYIRPPDAVPAADARRDETRA